jgi:hypothetical protein
VHKKVKQHNNRKDSYQKDIFYEVWNFVEKATTGSIFQLKACYHLNL